MNKFQILSNKLEQVADEIAELYTEEESNPINNQVLELYDIIIDICERRLEKISDFNVKIEKLLNECSLMNKSTIEAVSKIIIEILPEMYPEDMDDDIDDTIYNIKKIDNDTEIKNCSYMDSNTTILNFDFTQSENLIEFVKEIIINFGCDLGLIFLSKINIKEEYSNLLISNLDLENRVSEILSFLKITQLKQGKVLKEPRSYPSNNIISFNVEFSEGVKYNQFSDVIEILNEYNNHKFILDKYMRLYHIIENFMYRSQLCKLSKEKNYKIFSVNEFKSLNVHLLTKERTTLCNFINDIAKENYLTSKYEDEIFEKWKNTNVQTDINVQSKFEQVLNKFKIYKNREREEYYEKSDIASATKQKVIKIFPDLIYQFRCSIVHNKESEFHLSYNNLEESMLYTLNYFVIPTLQDMIYYLILNDNEVIWYERRELMLY